MKYLKKYESIDNHIKYTKYKGLLYHGTNIHPSKFKLIDDYDVNSEIGNGNVYEVDLPEGMIFLTNDIKEAKCYGKYVIPCEVKIDKMKVYKIDTDNPSVEWDDDFMGYKNYGMYSEMINKGYDMVEVRGRNKSTFVAFINVVFPRVDLVKSIY